MVKVWSKHIVITISVIMGYKSGTVYTITCKTIDPSYNIARTSIHKNSSVQRSFCIVNSTGASGCMVE